MDSAQIQAPHAVSTEKATVGRLFLLVLSNNHVVSLNSDGSDRRVIVTDCRHPDGIAVDVAAGHIYWTNMGNPTTNGAPSSDPTSTERTARRSFHPAPRSLPSNSSWKKRAEALLV